MRFPRTTAEPDALREMMGPDDVAATHAQGDSGWTNRPGPIACTAAPDSNRWMEADASLRPARLHGGSRGVFRQDALHDLMARRRGHRHHPVFTARLVAEPTNPADPQAVAVLIEGKIVGYLPKDAARRYCQLVAAQANGITCPAQLVGGTKAKPSIGVVLDFIEIDKLKIARM